MEKSGNPFEDPSIIQATESSSLVGNPFASPHDKPLPPPKPSSNSKPVSFHMTSTVSPSPVSSSIPNNSSNYNDNSYNMSKKENNLKLNTSVVNEETISKTKKQEIQPLQQDQVGGYRQPNWPKCYPWIYHDINVIFTFFFFFFLKKKNILYLLYF